MANQEKPLADIQKKQAEREKALQRLSAPKKDRQPAQRLTLPTRPIEQRRRASSYGPNPLRRIWDWSSEPMPHWLPRLPTSSNPLLAFASDCATAALYATAPILGVIGFTKGPDSAWEAAKTIAINSSQDIQHIATYITHGVMRILQ